MNFKIPDSYQRILITGGAGFIGGCLVRKLLNKTNSYIFNIDKLGYASDVSGINSELQKLGIKALDRYEFLKVDLANRELLSEVIKKVDPDIVFHLAAESHVDRSIDDPEIFLRSNIIGTFNLLEVLRSHFEKLSFERKRLFRLHHVSTDEVYGSIDGKGKFSEETPYNPKSPYSATKASSDHLVRAWYSSYGLPILISNCSNNYGPWQLPEKLIPLVIYKALNNQNIPVYGNGKNIRDWLHVDDHVEGILYSAIKGSIGSSYCIGGNNEHSNISVVKFICDLLNKKVSNKKNFADQITFVADRPGHDLRYSIDNSLIVKELGWKPQFTFDKGLENTVEWYLANQSWCKNIINKKDFISGRIGLKSFKNNF